MSLDVIDQLLGVEPGDRLDAIRAARPAARDNTQRTYDALFTPIDDGAFALHERYAVATFVAALHRHDALTEHYAALLRAEAGDLGVRVLDLAQRGLTDGPYGHYRESGLSAESTDGPRFAVPGPVAGHLGPRLTAALEHAHLLTFRPRESSADALQALLDAGWSATGAVTLSQLVAFLAYQIRLAHGLQVLAATEA